MNSKASPSILFVLVFSTFLNLYSAYGQTSLKEIGLNFGEYAVGFRHYITADSTRTYSRVYDYTNEKIPRPISISLWYPSNDNLSNANQLQVLNYFEVLKEEEEWEHLPNEQLLNWFYYANTPANQAHLLELTKAHSEIDFASGKFPVIVYAPSFQASSIENFALCEFLASHGYIVISSPARGTTTRWFSNNYSKEMETQARDLEFLMQEVTKIPVGDPDKLAVIGFSFGGLSSTIAQMRNDNIKAFVSLDGTERYQYALLEKSPFFDYKQLNVPYLHMAQKDIPDNVLKEDKIDKELNSIFQLYDSLTASQAYKMKFHDMTHAYFSTLGVLFEKRDQRQDKSDKEIMVSYQLVTAFTLNFLNAFLKDISEALASIEGQSENDPADQSLYSSSFKQPKTRPYSFQEFNDLAAERKYEDLFSLYDSIKKEHPEISFPEGHLNTLGLQLVFNPSTSKQGINVFLLATQLYPNSANLYDSMAEGYLFMGERTKAIESFEKSLQLNPNNQNAIDRLKQLK